MGERPVVVLAMAPVLTAGMIAPEDLERLRVVCEVPDPEPLERLDEARAVDLLGRCSILLSGWGCPLLDEAVLQRAPGLRAVVHAAGTVKNLVTPACFERGVRVSSAAAANALPVAEYTLAAILFAGKRVFSLQRRYAQVRNFRLWPAEFPGLGNLGKVVGIVGASRVGRRVMELLRLFDFQVLLHDPTLSESDARALGVEFVELDDLLCRSDIVSLHAPSLPETRHMLDDRRLALMRDGAVLINTARGALVDGEALERELVSGRLEAVIDTTEPELLAEDSPLYELPNVFLTPHVAGAMGTETRRMADLAIGEIERLVRGEPLEHEIRAQDLGRIA